MTMNKNAAETTLNQLAFFKRYNISEEEFAKSKTEWKELVRIYTHHSKNIKNLETTATSIIERLRQVKEVHSLKMRIKDPEHVMEKIIRKRCEKPDLEITVDSYQEHITDLIGIRALHLFKDEWKPIHNYLIETWDLQETPIAYIRAGDPEGLQDLFKESLCDVRTHPFGYRSVHYLIKSQPTKQLALAELQVRTLFEEGWSEIDHQIRYPYALNDTLISEYIKIFNRLAGSADEMGSFIKILQQHIRTQHDAYSDALASLAEKENKIKEMISKLEITQAQKLDLEKKVEELSKSSQMIPLGTAMQGLVYPGSLYDYVSDRGTFFSKVTIGCNKKVCVSCGEIFDDDSSFVLNNKCPKCRLDLG